MRENPETSLLDLRGVQISLKERRRLYPAVRGVSLSMREGRNLGLIGESGCGKTLLCHSVLGLLDPKKWLVEGEFLFEGKPLSLGKDGGRPGFSGTLAGFIAQDPAEAFDPRMKLKGQFAELLRGLSMDREEILAKARALLSRMELKDPDRVLESYPFQLSGGMLQRVMIAMALMGSPRLLVADEPTTALDATTRSDILELLEELKAEQSLTVLMVSHDLQAVSQIADDICVMYAGYVVEQGEADEVLRSPKHPYTKGLLASWPSFSKEPVPVMEGTPPGILEPVTGCPFAPRCPKAEAACKKAVPELLACKGNGRMARCIFAGGREGRR